MENGSTSRGGMGGGYTSTATHDGVAGGGGPRLSSVLGAGGGTPNGACRGSLHPTIVVLLCTLLCTSCATGMLCAAIITDHWEYVHWNRTQLEDIAGARQQVASAKVSVRKKKSQVYGQDRRCLVRFFVIKQNFDI